MYQVAQFDHFPNLQELAMEWQHSLLFSNRLELKFYNSFYHHIGYTELGSVVYMVSVILRFVLKLADKLFDLL